DAEERLDQLERGLVRPVQVFEDETERLLLGELADELVERLEGRGLDAFPVELTDALRRVGLERQVEQVGEERIEVLRLFAEERAELGFELQADARLGGGGADLEPLAQQVADRPVRKRLRVGDGAALDETDAISIAAPLLP